MADKKNNTVISNHSLSNVMMKVTLNISDPLRNSVKDEDETKELERKHNVSPGGIVVRKHVVDKGSVSTYRDPLKALKDHYYEYSLPIGTGKQAFRVVPKKSINDFTSRFNELKKDAQDAIKEFKREYEKPEWLDIQRQRMGAKFNEKDYKSPSEINEKLSVDGKVDKFADADCTNDMFLDAETASILQRDIEEMESSIRKYASENVWDQIMTPLSKMAEICSKEHGSGKGSIFRDTLIDNLNNVLNRIPALNFQGDARLEEVRAEAQNLIRDLSEEDLRDDPEKRKETAGNAKKVIDKIGGYTGMKSKKRL